MDDEPASPTDLRTGCWPRECPGPSVLTELWLTTEPPCDEAALGGRLYGSDTPSEERAAELVWLTFECVSDSVLASLGARLRVGGDLTETVGCLYVDELEGWPVMRCP